MGRFASLVDTPKNRETFKARNDIHANVSIQHCELGNWYTKRQIEDVVIPMTTFIEGGMRIPMDGVMRDFLNFFRIYPTQCSPNLFRVVCSVAQLNKKMGVVLTITHHDINWVYSCQVNKEGFTLGLRFLRLG